MAVSIQIAKFKLRQYQWRAISPNLMLAKVSHCTVSLACFGRYLSTPLSCADNLKVYLGTNLVVFIPVQSLNSQSWESLVHAPFVLVTLACRCIPSMLLLVHYQDSPEYLKECLNFVVANFFLYVCRLSWCWLTTIHRLQLVPTSIGENFDIHVYLSNSFYFQIVLYISMFDTGLLTMVLVFRTSMPRLALRSGLTSTLPPHQTW